MKQKNATHLHYPSPHLPFCIGILEDVFPFASPHSSTEVGFAITGVSKKNDTISYNAKSLKELLCKHIWLILRA